MSGAFASYAEEFYFIPAWALTYVTSVSMVCGPFVRGMIMSGHLRYRRYVNERRPPASDYRLPGDPLTNWFVLAFLVLVLVLLAFHKDTVFALYVAPVWVAVMLIAHLAWRSHHLPAARHLARKACTPRRL